MIYGCINYTQMRDEQHEYNLIQAARVERERLVEAEESGEATPEESEVPYHSSRRLPVDLRLMDLYPDSHEGTDLVWSERDLNAKIYSVADVVRILGDYLRRTEDAAVD